MKKLIALLLAMLCVFALAGCGSTEWTMIDMKGQESQLSAQDAAAVDQCLKGQLGGRHNKLRGGDAEGRRPVGDILPRLWDIQRSEQRPKPDPQRQRP